MGAEIDPQSRTVRDTRALRASGDSVIITMPPEVIQMAGLDIGDEVRLTTDFGGEGRIVIEATDSGSTQDEDANAAVSEG